MNQRLKLYIAFIYILGNLVIINSIININYFNISIVNFLVISIISEMLEIVFPKGASISVGFAINFASIITFGPEIAAIIAFVGAVVGNFKEFKDRWYKIFFNGYGLAITAYISGKVFLLSGGNLGVLEFQTIFLPLIWCILTYFLINNFIMSIVMGLATKTSFLRIWASNLKKFAINYVSLAPLGILMAGIFVNMGIYAVLLFFVPLLLARYSFKLYADMCNYYLSTVQAFAIAIEAKDKYTKGHSERVAHYSVTIGETLNLPESELETLRYAGLLHDIGKIGVSENILNKPDKLDKTEYEKIKDHPEIGANIVQDIAFLRNASLYIKHHHERWDGSGYPEKLKKDKISLGASILSVADVYDAMTSDRPYRAALSVEEAMIELKNGSGILYNPVVVDAMIKVIAKEQEKKNVG